MRLLIRKIATAEAGQSASFATPLKTTGRLAPCRHDAYPAAAIAAATTGHASYRVHIAANNAQPSFHGTSNPESRIPTLGESTHSTSHSTTRKVAASSSGSVIGVVWR